MIKDKTVEEKLEVWSKLHHLFDFNDGSLPDIYIRGLSCEEVEIIYQWIMSVSLLASDGNQLAWSLEKNCDVLIKDLENPARMVVEGKVEGFRHVLDKTTIQGVVLPRLSIRVDKDHISFDYCKGAEWDAQKILTLFAFLSKIKHIAQAAKIEHFSGESSPENTEFSDTFKEFLDNKMGTK